jgi:hypothetical protein
MHIRAMLQLQLARASSNHSPDAPPCCFRPLWRSHLERLLGIPCWLKTQLMSRPKERLMPSRKRQAASLWSDCVGTCTLFSVGFCLDCP